MKEEEKAKDIELKEDDNTDQVQEKEIDILEIVLKLWSNRKLLLMWCMWGVIAGLIIAFSIPREYTTKVTLAPEFQNSGKNFSGSIGALASLAGVSMSSSSGSDAVYPQLYPDIVSSVPFALSLLDVEVIDKEGKTMTMDEYLTDEISAPWWGVVMGLPGKMIGLITGAENRDDKTTEGRHSTFHMTKEEDKMVKMLRERISANVDQKTSVITIETKMQDPMVSAILADTVVSRLSEYITDYRTNKAKKDLAYAEQINEEARQSYYDAQQKLAEYIDKNQNLATQSARVTRERLENESSLAFNVYNQTALQVKNAESKVQENTPVYTTISPVTVPLRPTSPRKGLILAGFVFLALVGGSAWVIFGQPMVGEFKTKLSETNSENGDNPQPKKSWKRFFNKKNED